MTKTKIFSTESLSVLSLSKFKWFYPFESCDKISHVKKPGRLGIDVVLESLLMTAGKLIDYVCHHIDL